jgi:sugar/nucleoside kinase (ribokinase family)
MHGEENSLFDLVGIGNPVYDEIVTPWAKTDGRVLSGCSTNACLAAKKLGMKKVGLVGCVGRDFSDTFSGDMKKYGIEARVNISSQTGGFHLIYDEHGNRTLDVLGVAGNIGPENFPNEFLDSRFLLVGPVLNEVSLALLQYLRSSSSATIFLDPQGMVRMIGGDKRIVHTCNRSDLSEAVRLVDFVKPNEIEIETISGEKDPLVGIQWLDKLKGALPIVTLAERGSIFLDDGKLYRVPAYPTHAVDPTGAGDVYAGSFITEYVQRRSPSEAALLASAAASIKVEQVGPDFQLPLNLVKERKEAIRPRLAVEAFG